MINRIEIASEPKKSNLTRTEAHEKRKNNTSRKKVFSLIAMAAVFAAVFTSCEKDNDNNGPIQLLETISYGEKWYKKFEYDTKNRITQILSYYEDEIGWVETFGYDGDDLTLYVYGNPKNSNEGGSTKILSSGGKLILTFDEEYSETYDLDAQGNISGYQDSDYSSIWEYQNGNLIKITSVDTRYGELRTTVTTYTYDNKKSPYFHCKTSKWFFQGDGVSIQNNVLTRTRKSDDGYEDVETYEYTYDEVGFPLTSKEDGYEEITSYTYVKK